MHNDIRLNADLQSIQKFVTNTDKRAHTITLKHPDTEEEMTFSYKNVVCSVCRGEGSYVNPSIDMHGITQREMYQMGPDFEHDYYSGFYDVQCSCCKGNKVVPEVDMDYLSGEEEEFLKSINEWLHEEWEFRRMCEMEQMAERRFMHGY